MMNLYQKIKLLGTRGSSDTSLLKRTIKKKHGTIIDPNNMDVVPKEIASIPTIKANATDPIKVLKTVETDSPYMSIDNRKTGLVLFFFYDNEAKASKANYKYATRIANVYSDNFLLDGTLPQKDDGTNYVVDEDTQMIAIDKYIIIRFKTGEETCIDFFTEDGISWNSDLTLILNAYTPVYGRFCLKTDTSFSILTDSSEASSLYEMDFKARRMWLNYSGNISPDLYNENFSASTDNINYCIGTKSTDECSLDLIYSSRETPVDHKIFKLEENLKFSITKWLDATRLDNNSLLLLGLGSGNSLVLCNIIAEYGNESYFKPIVWIRNTGIIVTPNENSHISAKVICFDGICYLVTNETVYMLDQFSNSENEWKVVYSSPDGSYVHDVSTNGRFLFIMAGNYNEPGSIITMVSSAVKSKDVPKGKGFLTQRGELATGSASNSSNSVFTYGTICNMLLDDSIFGNISYYDSDYSPINISDICFYHNEYIMVIGFDTDLYVMRSVDGSTWTKGAEIKNVWSPVPTDKNISGWKLSVINGVLCIVRPGMSYIDKTKIIYLNITSESITVDDSKDEFWNLSESPIFDYIPHDQMKYLYTSCIGNVYGYYNQDTSEIMQIVSSNDYGYDVIYNEPFRLVNINSIENMNNGVIIFGYDSFYLAIDTFIYKYPSVLKCLNYKSVKAFVYKDILVILQESGGTYCPFMSFYKINQATMAIELITDTPAEYEFLSRKPYRPICALDDNILIVDDYFNREPAFTIDLDDNLRFVRFEDNRKSNQNKFIKYCHGKIFRINIVDKPTLSYVNSMGVSANWIDSTYSTSEYLAINDSETKVYSSNNGTSWSEKSFYGDELCDRIIAANNLVIALKTKEFKTTYKLSTSDGATWIECELPLEGYVQNIEVVNFVGTLTFILFMKENESDLFNYIFSSTNGIDWSVIDTNTSQSSLLKHGWRDITCGGDDVWVAIAEASNAIIYSTDAVTWIETTLPILQEWSSINYGNGAFFAVASNSQRAVISKDGITWNEVVLPDTLKWNSISYGNGIFVVIAKDSSYIAYGEDPENLSMINAMTGAREWMRCIYADNKFVAISANSSVSSYSLDGITWHDTPMPKLSNWRYLLYGSGTFIAINTEVDTVARSIDGIKWTSEEVDPTKKYRFVDFRNDKFVVFELSGNPSTDESALEFKGTSDTNKEWITGSYNGNNQCFASRDGVVIHRNVMDSETWYLTRLPLSNSEDDKKWMYTSMPTTGDWIGHAEHDNKILFGIKNSNKAVLSEDYGKTWEIVDLPLSLEWKLVITGLNLFLMIADNSDQYLYSADCRTWHIRSLPAVHTWNGAAYANQKFYLYAKDASLVYVTNNNIAWKEYEISDNPFSSMIWVNNKFIGVRSNSKIYSTSMSGITWIDHEFDTVLDYTSICTDGTNIVVIANDSDAILTSTDNGETWTTSNLPETNSNYKLIYLNDRFVLLGSNTNKGYFSITGIGWDEFELANVGDWVDGWIASNRYNLIRRNSGIVPYSYDCIYWYKTPRIDKILFGNGIFIAFDKSTAVEEESTIYYSANTFDWNIANPIFNNHIVEGEYGDGRFIVITDGKSNFVYESMNGVDWTKKYLHTSGIKTSITYGSDGFVILESNSINSHLIEGALKTKNTNLTRNINQSLVGEYRGFKVIFDEASYELFRVDNNGCRKIQLSMAITTSTDWKMFSGTDVMILYSINTMYIYNGFTDKWKVLYPVGRNIINGDITEVIIDSKPTVVFVDGIGNIQKLNVDGNDVTIEIITSEPLAVDEGEKYPIKICSNESIMLAMLDNRIARILPNFDFTLGTDSLYLGDTEIVDMIYGFGKFMVITNTEKYYVSYDGKSWNEYEFMPGMIPTNLSNTITHIAGLILSGNERYLFYTKNCIDIVYRNFDKTYGVDAKLGAINDNLVILKADSYLTELYFTDQNLVFSKNGENITDDKIIDPLVPRFAKGSFIISEANVYTKIDLNFTPRRVIVRTKSISSSSDFHEIILSESDEFYQNINSELTLDQSMIVLNKVQDVINVDGDKHIDSVSENKSMIIPFGFVITSPIANIEYEYFALS